jgi:hypothetical protein
MPILLLHVDTILERLHQMCVPGHEDFERWQRQLALGVVLGSSVRRSGTGKKHLPFTDRSLYQARYADLVDVKGRIQGKEGLWLVDKRSGQWLLQESKQ